MVAPEGVVTLRAEVDVAQVVEHPPEPAIADVLKVGRKRRRRWPWVVAGVGAVLLVIVSIAVCALGRGGWTWEEEAVERGALTLTIVAVGTLEPLDQVGIASELSGIVQEVHVDVNDPVVAGQPLLTLDTQLLAADVTRARAQVQSSEASLKQSKVASAAAVKARDRAESLRASGSISEAAYDDAVSTAAQAVAAVDVAAAQLAQARAAYETAQVTLSKSVVTSPIDGIVLSRSIEPGQAVVSSFSAATMFTVARDLRSMKVEVEVDEADVGLLAEGQHATFTVSAWPDRVFEATVHRVHKAPSEGQQVVTYAAELRLDNPDGILLPGMTATAEIVTKTLTDVLLVPDSALRFSPPDVHDLEPPEPRDGKRVSRVWVNRGDEPEAVEIVPGMSDGRKTVVLEGDLEAGDHVIVDAIDPRKAE